MIYIIFNFGGPTDRVAKSTNKTNHRNETSASRSKLGSELSTSKAGYFIMFVLISLGLFFVRGLDPNKIDTIAAIINLVSSVIGLIK